MPYFHVPLDLIATEKLKGGKKPGRSRLVVSSKIWWVKCRSEQEGHWFQKEAWVQSSHPLPGPAPSEVRDLAGTKFFSAPLVWWRVKNANVPSLKWHSREEMKLSSLQLSCLHLSWGHHLSGNFPIEVEKFSSWRNTRKYLLFYEVQTLCLNTLPLQYNVLWSYHSFS